MSEDQSLLSVCDQQSLPAEDFHTVNSGKKILYYGDIFKCEYMFVCFLFKMPCTSRGRLHMRSSSGSVVSQSHHSCMTEQAETSNTASFQQTADCG